TASGLPDLWAGGVPLVCELVQVAGGAVAGPQVGQAGGGGGAGGNQVGVGPVELGHVVGQQHRVGELSGCCRGEHPHVGAVVAVGFDGDQVGAAGESAGRAAGGVA